MEIMTHIVRLKILDVLVKPFSQLRETGRGFEVGRLDERAPRPDLFPTFGQPFPVGRNQF